VHPAAASARTVTKRAAQNPMFDVRCSMLDARCSMFDVRVIWRRSPGGGSSLV
jgi:hypothetical protein